MDLHCMIDLETLGRSHDAAIIQVGWCIFSPTELILSAKRNVDFNDACKHGTVTGDTIKWWLQQSEGARKSVCASDSTDGLRYALECLAKDIEQYNPIHFWAHASFDFPIIANAYAAVGLKSPLNYRQLRDLRTLDMLAQAEFISNWPLREGNHHDAMDDATHQARCVQLMMTHVGMKAVKDIL